MNDEEDFYLLGFALYGVQAFEFGLYGLASHCCHLPDAQSQKRFRDLDPEKFLRGDISDLKATLGQISKVFGEAFLIACDDLDNFITNGMISRTIFGDSRTLTWSRRRLQM